MSTPAYVVIDPVRSLAFGSISGTFAQVGSVTTRPIRLVCFTNNTDGDMFFSIDGVNNQLFVPAGSFKLFDLTTNKDQGFSSLMAFLTGTQFWVKQSSMPTRGTVYIECL